MQLAEVPESTELAEQEHQARIHYNKLLSSTLDLVQQQSKIDWIKYGDAGTRFFHAKAKQRKLQLYVYSLQDNEGHSLTGFEAVSDELSSYYSHQLGSSIPGQPPKQEVINMGPRLPLELQQPLCAPILPHDIKAALFPSRE